MGTVIGDACPTFSWGIVEQATSYEFVVYKVDEESQDSKSVLWQSFPGSVHGWTPPLDLCLERGGQYAWSVRAVGRKEASDWSAPSLFEVAAGPSREEFEAAVEVVKSYLAVEKVHAESVSTAEKSTVAEEPQGPTTSGSPGTRGAPVATQLSVDGNIDAVSFTGDGENLTNVATDAELGAHDHLGGDGAAVLHSSLGSVGASDHHAPTVDTFVTNKDAHDHLGDDGAAVLHSSLGSVGAGDHHARYTAAEVLALITVNNHCRGSAGSTDRYTDCGNGTVRDNNTSLIWLKDAGCADLAGTEFGRADWATAQSAAAALADGTCGVTDGSQAGDWRQPTVSELCSAWAGETLSPCPSEAAADSLIDSSLSGSPFVSNAAGTGLWSEDDPFVGVRSFYWSATESDAINAWLVNLAFADLHNGLKSNDFLYVWPVRGGQ